MQAAAKLWLVEADGGAVGTPLLERELDMVPNATFKVLLFGG